MAKRSPDDRAYITYGDIKLPVSLYFERRRNTRISIGTETIHLRLPGNLSRGELKDQVEWAEKWLFKRFEKSPLLLERFKLIQFRHGDRIQILSDVYVIHLKLEDKKSSTARLDGNDIYIGLADGMDQKNRHKAIQALIHKILCRKYLSFFKKRILELNDKYFRAEYDSIKVKYINSKWGSCSTAGEIILSSKLLLCPAWVRDYVIVHELAHLIEHNHSPAFWETVASALPDYEKAEAWLNNEGTGVEVRPLSRLHMPTNLLSDIDPEVTLPKEKAKVKEKPSLEPIESAAEKNVVPEIIKPEIPKTSDTKVDKVVKKEISNAGEQLSLF